MELRKKINNAIRKYLNEQQFLNENQILIDKILDKISKKGKENLSYDEQEYLEQYNSNKIDKGLENWLLNDDDSTFSNNGEKLLYDEFEPDEDLFGNRDKLKRVITKALNKKPFTNNSDWGGGLVWSLKSNDNIEGLFLYLSQDNEELILLRRSLVGDEYEDKDVQIDTVKELYQLLVNFKKNKL